MRNFFKGLFAGLVAAVLSASFAGITTTPSAPSGISYQGSVPDQGQLTQFLSTLQINGSAFSPFINTYTSALNAGGSLLPGQVVNTLLLFSNASCTTCNAIFPSSVSVVQSFPGGTTPGTTFWTQIANFSPGVVTLVAGSGITLTGTATIARSAVRYYVAQVVTSQTITLSSVYAVSSGVTQ